jgi:hypothetical protein
MKINTVLVNACVRVRSRISFSSVFKLNTRWSVPLLASEIGNLFLAPFAEFSDSRVKFCHRVR